MSENAGPAKRRRKRFLSPSQKYEIYLQLVRQEVTMAEAATAAKPGVKNRERDYELEAAKAEVARLSEACKELAVKLTLVEGKDPWD